jgi:hypothetical protein
MDCIMYSQQYLDKKKHIYDIQGLELNWDPGDFINGILIYFCARI